MVRSRSAFCADDDDPNQSRAKKKKVALGPENAEAEFTDGGILLVCLFKAEQEAD
ncbi:hypothetical protein CDL15_Pgr021584 [Punica granatum]|uniref:Uncharacterized protein n=1 Tax=Punica granatum TaxID=22663 RepID=A0A218WSS1_PUNGR|nr:hypothetical protein CDL15_Pgr021584 [Punica granatum]